LSVLVSAVDMALWQVTDAKTSIWWNSKFAGRCHQRAWAVPEVQNHSSDWRDQW